MLKAKLMIKILTVLSMIIWDLSSHGQGLPQPLEHPSPAAMGNAYTSIANDDSAPWTNPAGIARISKSRSRDKLALLRTPFVILGSNNFTAYGDIASLQGRHLVRSQGWDSGTSVAEWFPGIDKLDDDLTTAFTEDLSSKVWGRVDIGALSIFNLSNEVTMSLGFYATSQGYYELNDAAVTVATDITASTDVRYTDVINIMPLLGFAFSNQSKRFNFGVQVRPTHRYAYEGTNPLGAYGNKEVIIPELSDNTNSYGAIAYDLGFLWTVADYWFPTIGASVFNIPTDCKEDYLNPYDQTEYEVCGTLFEDDDTVNNTASANLDPTDIRVGVSIMPRFSRKIALRFAADIHYILHKSSDKYYGLPEVPLSQKTHYGMEMFVGNPLSPAPFRLKGGFNQEQFTWGANLNLGYVQIDFAAYGIDLSNSETEDPDRRFLLSVSTGM